MSDERAGSVRRFRNDGERDMRGPTILARTMSVPTARGSKARPWQYHSRGDSHSKVACWAVLLDLMLECDAFRDAIQAQRIGFRINHEMVGPINKTLDLVVTIASRPRDPGGRSTFADLALRYGIVLEAEDSDVLSGLPQLVEDRASDAAEVAIALEAKACMTEHLKSIPRLHAEILATGYLAKLAVPHCITVSYSLVNAAEEFVSPTNSASPMVNRHRQPEAARRVVSMLGSALPLARVGNNFGYDVVGVTVVNCRNDGSRVVVVEADPAPSTNEAIHYERMIHSLCSEFRERFRRHRPASSSS